MLKAYCFRSYFLPINAGELFRIILTVLVIQPVSCEGLVATAQLLLQLELGAKNDAHPASRGRASRRARRRRGRPGEQGARLWVVSAIAVHAEQGGHLLHDLGLAGRRALVQRHFLQQTHILPNFGILFINENQRIIKI